MPTTLSKREIAGIGAYWRAANYLTVGQIYAQHPGGQTHALTDHCTAMLARHETYIREHLEDMPRGRRLDVDGAVTAGEAG